MKLVEGGPSPRRADVGYREMVALLEGAARTQTTAGTTGSCSTTSPLTKRTRRQSRQQTVGGRNGSAATQPVLVPQHP
ncbi:hypothetical protein TUM20985_39330 [Mycobacterium antarcticum]|nr:hypothetical protein TUM20985_39330 [Mycolicibacterium sp. TUM20985]GLP83043.1 hypothetical protein TUM20984_44630 [Mycolicibacterium sp. TUM20984]